MAAATLTVYPEAASVHEGRLAIGGCDVLELAREFGTPAYVVAEDDLLGRAREFVQGMAEHHGERGRVAFASKAFPCTEVLRIFRDEGLAVDVAALGELHLARRAGYGPGGTGRGQIPPPGKGKVGGGAGGGGRLGHHVRTHHPGEARAAGPQRRR